MAYQPLDYELQRQRMVEYELQMNAVEAQKAIIELGKRAKQAPIKEIQVHKVEVVREDDHARNKISRLLNSNSILNNSVSVLKQEISDLEKENSKLYNKLTKLELKLIDVEGDLSIAKSTIKHLKEEVKYEEKRVHEIDAKLIDREIDVEELTQKLSESHLEQLRLHSELQRLGGPKQPITPQHTPKATKPVLARSMTSQGHTTQQASPTVRWIMKKSVEQMKFKSSNFLLYVPTDDERKKLAFMEQHNLFRMNEMEIPSEYDHIINMDIWNSK